jgi:hypothetical protein
MYANFIKKMTNHFSELGNLIYSKACDYSELYPITKDDIMMYYKLLTEDDSNIPENISKKNHISCCLYYLTKYNKSYKDVFIDKFLKNMSVKGVEQTNENLTLIFNIIEFDKIYLNSSKDHILFLYQLLRAYGNFPTNFENFIIYKYFRGFLKFRIGEYENTNKEYLEAVSELTECKNQNFYIKYLSLRNSLLKVKLYHFSKKTSKAAYTEYYQFLKDLFDQVKFDNKTLAIRLGLDLFSAYFEGKSYSETIPLLIEMKKLLKKELLKGSTIKDGIDYYLAISSRLGYMGILLDNKNAINSAIKKIKKTLEIIKNDKNEKLKQMFLTYSFVLSMLEIGLNKKTNFDLKTLAFDFQRSFIPDLGSKSHLNYIINEENKDGIILDFKIINSMNSEIANCAKSILNKCVSELQNKTYQISTFLNFILAVHDKIYCNAESYISDPNEKMRNYYKMKLVDYAKGAYNFIYKLLDEEPLLYTEFVKTLIIDIFSANAHIYIYDKNYEELRILINTMDDLKKKLKIEESTPAFALVNKVKGDFWFHKVDYKAAILYYEKCLNLLEKNNIKIPPILFNIGCSFFFLGDKNKAKQYLNRCISEYNNIFMEKNDFGYTFHKEVINKKIVETKRLLAYLSKI